LIGVKTAIPRHWPCPRRTRRPSM